MAIQLPELSQLKIGFIGAGNMAQAIGIGLIKEGTINPSRVIVSAPSVSNFPQWAALGVVTTHNNAEVVLRSEVIFLAVKPQVLDDALDDIKRRMSSKVDKSKLFVSLVAGTSLEALYRRLVSIDPRCRIMRMMPNTAFTVAAGVAGIAAHNRSANEIDVKLIEKLFSTRGLCVTVPERLITPIGALAGSGIAYVYLMIEALSDGGVKMGIPRKQSTVLAAQTVLGASRMILETEKHPAVLKDEVCSAGGTTIEGIHQLERGSFRGTVIGAVEAAAMKSERLQIS